VILVHDDNETFLTVDETCELLGISRQALDGYVKRGQLKRYERKLGRRVFFKKVDVEGLMKIVPEEDKE
jgi:excisionase family DNA binding protein